MADETSAGGAPIGGGDDYGRFMRSVGGSMSKFLPNGGVASNQAAGPTMALTSSLNRLSGQISTLITTLSSANFGGGAGGGGGGGVGPPGTASSGKPNGGNSSWPHGGPAKWAVGAATLGAAGFASLYQNRMGTALDIYPMAQQSAAYSGMLGNTGMNATLHALQNSRLTAGTTGPQDTGQANAIVSQYFRSSPNQLRGMNAMTSSSLLARVMGTDLTGGANLYTELMSPSTSWALRSHGLANFRGVNGTQVNPIAQSMGIVQGTPGMKGLLNGPNALANFTAATQVGQKGFASLVGASGSSDAANAIVQAVTAQLTYQKNGGTGILGPGASESQLNKAGLSSIATSAMRKAGIDMSKQGFVFAQSQQQNVASTLAVQMQIRDKLNNLAQMLGPLGRLTPVLGGLTKAIELLAAYKIAGGSLPGLGGIFGGGAGAAGGAAGGGSGGGAGLAGLGAAGGLAGIAALGAVGLSKATGSASHSSNPLVSLWGKSVGVGLNSIPGLSAGVHNIERVIGDPPPTNNSDMQVVSSHNNAGASAVSGLRADLLHDVASMMRANPRLVLNSGYRTAAQQKALYAKNPNSKWVAKPGSSMHEKGLAVDLGPKSEYGWLKSHGGKYGLVNYAPEPWHWEPRGASSAGNRTDYGVSGTAPAGAVNAGASTTGSFVANMAASASGGPGVYGASQGSLFSLRMGAPTEQGGMAYHYAGSGVLSTFGGSGGSASAGSGGASGSIGPMPTGGDKRVPGHSITQWAHDLLTSMGVAASPPAMDALIRWANHESGGFDPSKPGGLYNPLNTTEGHYGYARNGGAQGNIKDYKSYDQGIQNQAWNLTHTKGAGYDKILSALRGTNEQSMFQAIDNSKFGTHGLGDPPSGGGGGGGNSSVSLSSRTTPITATFHVYAGDNPEKLARTAFTHLQNLQRDAEHRNS